MKTRVRAITDVKKVWRYLQPFRHNTAFYRQTDRRTDGIGILISASASVQADAR